MTIALAFLISACSWSPSPKAVPVTEPWASLELPVSENAVVWRSEPEEFRAVHKEEKKAVMAKYVEALNAKGWTLGRFDTDSTGAYSSEFQRGSDRFGVRIYDSENTGVVIEKK